MNASGSSPMDVAKTDQPLPSREPGRWAAKVFDCGLWLVSAALWAFVATCYWQRYDAVTYATLFPAWTWSALGLLLAWPFVARRKWRSAAALAALWLALLLALSDTPSSLLRACLPLPERDDHLRVITLNAAGQGDAVRRAAALEPDFLLVQESYNGIARPALAAQFGAENMLWDYDAAIIARGKVERVAVPPEFRNNFLHARVVLDGTTFNVISLRLVPCPIRLDFWSADCWRFYRGNREMRRMQLQKIAGYAATLPADEPLVVGGDFNCPPWDPCLDLLKPRLRDAFTVAGRGWGATIIELAGWPLIRIDQIWTSDQLRATNVFAAGAAPSDHHMTVADFALEKAAN